MNDARYRYSRGKIVSPLPARAFIQHEWLGRLELSTREEVVKIARQLERETDDESLLIRMITEGRYFDAPCDDPDREEKSPAATRQIRALLLGTDTGLASVSPVAPQGPPAWLIRDVWEAGTFPQLSGNSKAGKSEVCLDVIRTLVDPSHLFLGRFERGDINPLELECGVVYLNMENPPNAIEEALKPLEAVPFEFSDGTVGSARDLVTVYHLRETLGGPSAFDPRDPDKFEAWRRVLTGCDECDGEDNWGPFAVIADNGTAVLRALSENIQEHIGEWFEALRRLLAEIDTPQGIGVAHATMDGKNALGGTISSAASDGEWTYSRRGTSGAAPRFFAISPRLGPVPPLPETRVTRDADGRLRLSGAPRSTAVTTGAEEAYEGSEEVPASPDSEHEAAVLELLRAAGSEGLGKTEVTGRGNVGSQRRAALVALEERGLVVTRSKGRRTHYRAVEFVSDTTSTGSDTP
ncbi:hypothetical protein C5B85_01920 [Pseudoclavibacter sp. AY1F1]|uniref:AAA family ATPase n=1 Tax=Pseudoclavibacter sp. AY1F1 TaxID=2080583 RepID=UPI000CE7BD9C|nr:AAA family ATPase [Pseudoclavibacter sp. AY1F1]PPF47057.1 hypothetical protein C5B85_01920 [Pseudoclavibacter sp. AY1F1]